MITIGVLGGIGPEATGLFYLKLVAALQKSGLMQKNEDFPRIIINSIPAPELVNGNIGDGDLLPYHEGLAVLDALRPDFIVMVCNTIHLFYDALQERIRTPIIDVRHAVAQTLHEKNITRAGILATQLTISRGLYACSDVELLVPTAPESRALMQAVVQYNLGRAKDASAVCASSVAARMLDGGAQCVILGCTEFAAMLHDTNLPVIGTLDILVRATVERFKELKAEKVR